MANKTTQSPVWIVERIEGQVRTAMQHIDRHRQLEAWRALDNALAGLHGLGFWLSMKSDA